MSLKSLDIGGIANTAAVMVVNHPTDRTPLKQSNDSDISISMVGKDSDIFVKASRIARNLSVEQAKKRAPFSAAQQDKIDIETIARCATGWSGIPKCWLDGGDDESAAEFSFENAVKLYTRQKWIFEQADEFVGGRENLLKASAKN